MRAYIYIYMRTYGRYVYTFNVMKKKLWLQPYVKQDLLRNFHVSTYATG